MTDKKFKWLAGSCVASENRPLETGGVYSVADFGEEIVAWWIEQKNAEAIGEKKSEKTGGKSI